jgi:three-Cys-motif partner protein
MVQMQETFEGLDDGLVCPDVGAWSEGKYRLIRLYDSLFSSGMKDKWDVRVYIDLYAGAGYCRIRNTRRILMGSPLLALTVANPFDKYVFCEELIDNLRALEVRTRQLAPNAAVAFVQGDCNAKVDEILAEIPLGSKERRVLGLCFVDPFDLGIKFETLRKLSSRYIDFVCLLALHMDANRNQAIYIKEHSHKIDDFLGTSSWRGRWNADSAIRVSFPKFLANEFSAQMKALNYIPPPFYTMKEVRSDEKNLPLYHLALFSRHPRGYQFWDEVLRYSDDQLSMF